MNLSFDPRSSSPSRGEPVHRNRHAASSERIAAEQKWYALTGRVIEVRAEEDGDLHIALADANDDKPGFVVAEIPAKPEWCELRKIVFGWTSVQFPFRVRSGRKLKLMEPLIITVIGKAFFDIGHAPADHSNRRTDLQGYAAWEIHPVMKLDVQKSFYSHHATFPDRANPAFSSALYLTTFMSPA